MQNKQVAPFQRQAQFSRDSFLRVPDWRWQQARLINNAKISGLTRPQPSDTKVIFAARLQRAFKDPKKRQFIQLKMNSVYQICTLGTADNNAPLKCQLQACLICGLDSNAVNKKLKWITPTQVDLYKDLFFDLSGVQGLSGWFQQMLLIPAKNQKNSTLFRVRALAHYHSMDAALKSIRFGKSGKVAKQAMAQMWKDQRNKRIFDYMAKNLNVPVQVYTNIMQQAIQSVQNRDFTLQLKGQNSQTSAALQYANTIQKGIRGFTQAQINASNQAYKSGVDDTTKYIKMITQE